MSKQLDYLKRSCLSYLSRFERSRNRIGRFLHYWGALESFITAHGGMLSEKLLWDFDTEYPTVVNNNERHDLRRNLIILCFVSLNGLPPEGFHIPICQSFWKLPTWCRKAIRDFQKTCSDIASLTTLSNYEVTLSCFFLRLNLASIRDSNGLTHKAIINYKASDKSAALSKRQRNSDVKSFLKYLENLELVKPTLHLVLEPSYQDEAILLDLQQEGSNSWKCILDSAKAEPIEIYGQGILKLEQYLSTVKYSQCGKSSLVHGAIEFQLFLYSNDLGYSVEIADKWLDLRHPFWSRRDFYTNYRALHLIDELLREEQVSASFFHKDHGKCHIPENLDNHLQEYINEREQEGLQPSSISMIHSSCCRFLLYVESQGIDDLSMLTPWVVKDFNLQDQHVTVEGKQAYNTRIRQFLLFLASKNLVPHSLHLAIPTVSAPKNRIVTVLNAEQKTAIESHFNHTGTKKIKRDNAVLALGYDLGLRGIDIVTLRFSNIDWEREVIKFRQRKTGVWANLPFTANVGNALYTYISEARPESGLPYIFLSFKAPFKNMRSGICGNSVNRVLQKAGLAPGSGFHITRKTFASELLQAGTPFSTISDFLGHTDNTTLKVYLASNEPGLRQCAMTLQGIEYRGHLL